MIRNIIWDLDGTLFDTYPAILQAFHRAVEDCGVHIPYEWVLRQARNSLTLYADALVVEYKLDAQELRRRYIAYYDEYPLKEQRPFPGVEEVCKHIRSKGGINVIVTHRRWSSAKKLLSTYKMSQYFTGLLTAEEGYPPKPDPAMFEEVISRFDLERSQTLAVGDRDIDILAGNAAGVKTCLYRSGGTELEPDLVIHNYGELLQLLLDGGSVTGK